MTDAAEIAGADAARPAARTWRTPVVQTSILLPIAIALGSLLAGAIYTWFVGEDVNWDWMNYHEYNVWAVINDRYGIDAMPAGFQTYFNPVVYFPIYYLRHLLPLPYGMMIMGAVHGLNLLLIYFLVRVLLRQTATVSAIGAAILIAAVGPMTLSEVGTSFSDILTALPILAGCVLILSAGESNHGRYVLAGLLIGAAVGLKLTNAVYAIGAVAAVLAAGRPVMATLCLGIGGAAGALATGGAWSLMLWREFGNPVFPMFNAVFRSPELMAANIMDWQFLPRGLLDALAYPFYWLVGDNRSSEYPFRDARFAVATVLIVLGIGRGLVTRTDIFTRRDTQFLLFFGVSYAAWLAVFAIQRYAVVLELLCAPLIVLLIARNHGRRSRICSTPRGLAAPECGDAGRGRGHRAVVATGRLVPSSLVQSVPAGDFEIAGAARELSAARQAAGLYRPAAAAAVAVLSDRRHRPAGHARRQVRPPHSHRVAGSAAGRQLGTAHARQADPRTVAGALRPARRCFPPCVEIEGAWLGTAVEACPLVAREK